MPDSSQHDCRRLRPPASPGDRRGRASGRRRRRRWPRSGRLRESPARTVPSDIPRRPNVRGDSSAISRAICSIGTFESASISAPMSVCVFMTSNSSGVSFPGFRKMASGMPILPTSCIGAAWRMHFRFGGRPSGGLGQRFAQQSRPADVHARLLVAPERGRDQAMDDLLLGKPKFFGPFVDFGFQSPCVEPFFVDQSFGVSPAVDARHDVGGEDGRERHAGDQGRPRPPGLSGGDEFGNRNAFDGPGMSGHFEFRMIMALPRIVAIRRNSRLSAIRCGLARRGSKTVVFRPRRRNRRAPRRCLPAGAGRAPFRSRYRAGKRPPRFRENSGGGLPGSRAVCLAHRRARGSEIRFGPFGPG